MNDKRPKQKTVREESDETFYCPKCDVSFQSLAEHTSNYHDGSDVFVQVGFERDSAFITIDKTGHEMRNVSRKVSCESYLCERGQKLLR